jgi:hypothetical protein
MKTGSKQKTLFNEPARKKDNFAAALFRPQKEP